MASWKDEWKEDVVYLHVLPRQKCKCVPNFSPFAIKLETWLRIHDIPYEVVDYMGVSSKGQSPFIFFNKEQIPDSNFIIEFLSKKFNVDPYAGLTAPDRAVARAFLKMIEENTSWSVFWYRYVRNLQEYRSFIELPDEAAAGLSKGVEDSAVKHGIGRHSDEEIYKIGSDDFRAISAFLGDKPYMFGDKPTVTDCSLFGFLIQVVCLPMGFPMKKVIEVECSNLLEFVERMKTNHFQHWNEQFI